MKTQVHSSEVEEVNIKNRPLGKRCVEFEQGHRVGDKKGQTGPEPRGLGGLLKQVIPI